MKLTLILCGIALMIGCAAPDTVTARRIEEDFEVTGAGEAPAWEKAEWEKLKNFHGEGEYQTRFKTLYSENGIYFLFDCEDEKLTATIEEDFGPLYSEDVVEVFLWPYEGSRVYFEYEISPLGYELPLLVVNHENAFQGWRPWNYEDDRLVRKGIHIIGGEKEPHAEVEGWRAEFFIPFALLRGMGNMPPEPGTQWRANMYRIDYDKEQAAFWAWSELEEVNFHRIEEFGTLVFE